MLDGSATTAMPEVDDGVAVDTAKVVGVGSTAAAATDEVGATAMEPEAHWQALNSIWSATCGVKHGSVPDGLYWCA